MKPENSSWYAVHLFVDNKEKEIHLWADDVQVSPSGHLLFFINSNNLPTNNSIGNHNITTAHVTGSEPIVEHKQSKIHFAFAPNFWKAFWMLDAQKLPYSLNKIEQSAESFNHISQSHSNKKDETTRPHFNGSFNGSSTHKTDVKSFNNEPHHAQPVMKNKAFSVSSFSDPTSDPSFEPEILDEINDKKSFIVNNETEKIKQKSTNYSDEKPVAVQLLTDEQRTLNYLAQHPYLGVNSLSATLDIEQDVLEKMLLQLCKERKIPISYLSLPIVQEELSEILPEIMAQKPKNISEVMTIIEAKKANQEIESEIELLQVHIWIIQDLIHKKQESNPENT